MKLPQQLEHLLELKMLPLLIAHSGCGLTIYMEIERPGVTDPSNQLPKEFKKICVGLPIRWPRLEP